MAKPPPNDIHQFSLLSAFHAGLKEGGPPAAFLATQGTHGLGISEDDEADMLQLDSECYTFSDEGEAARADPEDQMPFVMVTAFQPAARVKPPRGTTSATIREVFEGKAGKNTPLPFRLGY
ncbi:hypothetical protein BDY17DRAFT_324237 [Neohortaea acidophila]|uniref:Alpha-acetolactate decarboxylase n=1 Tax=Neohortaea acidophila TaxID=245834 RepID=A0A6A6PU49_9PEZI|nr:uncharacterized protein BDY17DRAFT_324237 [Neohortaea acidophila]KAF2483512.1 hypothetical protein BDY17DRAFT_324237 [Neohortaea acidophila]